MTIIKYYSTNNKAEHVDFETAFMNGLASNYGLYMLAKEDIPAIGPEVIKAMVEIKEESLEHWGVARVMQQLLRQLETSQDNCVLISFSYTALEYARAHSHLEIGWVLHSYDSEHKYKATALNPNYLICNHDKLPNKQSPWPGPWRWMLYDITSPQTALEWGEMGVDLIETGEIGLMLRDEKLVTRACYHGV